MKQEKTTQKLFKRMVIIAFICAGILVILLLVRTQSFCGKASFDIGNVPEYKSCSNDSDCFAKSCGCINAEGKARYQLVSETCGIAPDCSPPLGCTCENGICFSD